jgi:hypothetical protein
VDHEGRLAELLRASTRADTKRNAAVGDPQQRSAFTCSSRRAQQLETATFEQFEASLGSLGRREPARPESVGAPGGRRARRQVLYGGGLRREEAVALLVDDYD